MELGGNKLKVSFLFNTLRLSLIFKISLQLVLKSLKIQNFALITSLEIDFHEGMTSVTGETGAGKSILLEGLSLALGKRADLSVINDHNKKCIVEAEFQIFDYHLKPFFDRQNLDYDELTTLRREVTPSGKSRAFVNDTPVTLNVLEQLSSHLIDIHSQMENAAVFQKEFQYLVIDSFANQQDNVTAFEHTFKKWQRMKREYTSLLEKQEADDAQLSLKRFFLKELDEAQLEDNEFEALQQSYSEMQHLDFLSEAIREATDRLESEPAGILYEMIELRALLNKMMLKSNRLSQLFQQLQNLISETEDFQHNLRQVAESIQFNPNEQATIEAKLNQYNSLLYKHQVNDVSALIAFKDKLASELSQTEGISEKITLLEQDLKKVENEMEIEAKLISEKRKTVVPELCEALQNLVARMGMTQAKFQIAMKTATEFNAKGKDELELLFCANPGSTFQNLKKTVSGGEQSRIMLAIKTILSSFKKLPTIIFDEIDTGVSGKISDQIAAIMAELSENMQVFAITHLPQVAAKGTHHYKVLKKTEAGVTQTILKKLSAEERAIEIAQMLSGNKTGVTAIAHAKELLK